jgi:CspA family cold shock protein
VANKGKNNTVSDKTVSRVAGTDESEVTPGETKQHFGDTQQTVDTQQTGDSGQPPIEDIKDGELVWYNERKGYGFVRIDDAEVFLHRSTLDRFGLVRLLTGDRLRVSLTTNEHGHVIQDLLGVTRPINTSLPAASVPDADERRAIVKFFNDLRGYGFVTAEDMSEDVFVHSRVLNDCGFHSLFQGQKLLIKIDDSGRGPQVLAVRLLNE